MTPDVRRALLNTLLLVPAMVLSIVFSLLAIEAANRVIPPFASFWFALALNALPAILAGVVVYGIAARLRRTETPSRHVIRSAPLYCATLALVILIALEWHRPGFGLVAQLFVWPLGAPLGGIAADALIPPVRVRTQ